jgi:hypothetical protein
MGLWPVDTGIALAHGDHLAIFAAFHQIALHVLGQAPKGPPTDAALQATATLIGEKTDDAAIAVKQLIAVIEQPSLDQRGNATMLGTASGMKGNG